MNKKDATAAVKENIVKRDIKHLFSKGHFYPFRKWWWVDLKYIFWNAKNRYFYGYSDEDWFNWDYKFAERNLELFKQFRDNNHSLMHRYPYTMREYYPEGWSVCFTEEEQNEFFNNLIDCLEDIKDQDCERICERLYGTKDITSLNGEQTEEVYRERQASIDFFFDSVRDRFDDFWD